MPWSEKSIEASANKIYRFLEKIEEKTLPRSNGIYAFPEVFRIGWQCFRLNKKETKKLLKQMEKLGFIKIIPYHGILPIKRRE